LGDETASLNVVIVSERLEREPDHLYRLVPLARLHGFNLGLGCFLVLTRLSIATFELIDDLVCPIIFLFLFRLGIPQNTAKLIA